MQKKIIALAIASALTMPALALAEATVYGQVNASLEMTDSGDKTAGADPSTNSISSNASRLGLKGSEDLGDGLTMVWQMEGTVGMDKGAGAGTATALFDRNTFAGLAGGFGTVVLGQHDTPYKLATRGLDVFADTIADNRSMMGGGSPVQGLLTITHDARLSDVVAYISPNFNGVSIAAALHGGSDSMSLLGNYAAGPLSVSLGYQDVQLQGAYAVKSTGVKTADAIGTKLGGSYTMDAFTVGLVYEMLSLKPVTGNATESNNIYVSGKYNVSDKGAVKLAYTMAGESKTGGVTATGSGANQLAVGYDHSLTKSTTLYALYTAVSNDTGASYGLTSAGSSSAVNVVTAGDDPTAIAVGLRHSF